MIFTQLPHGKFEWVDVSYAILIVLMALGIIFLSLFFMEGLCYLLDHVR